ncbi:uncharacterized protein LOC109397735 [Aedes albopictus]|uniref:DUF243 domain-containing protein n=2 Tax=Aedes albopictus TaxID=7160 RepID=A0ABM1YJJ0_AEDAL|nr:uncharacterized protein LOC109397735 [Aedes albopictus]XP_029734236.1 uncharacterized protein LOC115269564 [Aedes albopictus]
MKILVVLACVAMAAARPEAPLHGYNYPAPRPVVHQAVASSAAHATAHGHGGGYFQAQAPVQVHAPVHAPVFPSSGFGSAISGGAFGSGHATGLGGGFTGGFSSGASQVQGFAPQQTVVQKHIYVHVPPQEPEETRAQQIVSQGVPRKHYKIIFIKTPNVQPSAAQIALQQAQQEEKTIVYVLVKKPDEQADINIPQLPALPPSKPEVYFIKYKANKAFDGGVAQSGLSGAVGSASAGLATGLGSSGHGSGHGFDATLGSLGASASSSASSVGGSLPHTEYGAPTGHQGYP